MCEIFNSLDSNFNGNEIISFFVKNKRTLIGYFNDHPGFSSFIQYSWENSLLTLSSPNPYSNPAIVLNLASILNQVQAEDEFIKNEKVFELNRCRIISLLEVFVNLSGDQVKLLFKLINNIVDYAVKLSGAKIYLIECPVGNSIPTKLLHEILKTKHLNPIILKISLSRNDSVNAGKTRKQLIESIFNSANLDAACLLIYLDEWITGVNFYNLTNHFSNILKNTNSYFLPVGYLVPSSKNYSRHQTFIKYHNKLIDLLGLNGNSFRIELPFLMADNDNYPYFFSEHDRLAGYRKMQIFGSIFSSIDNAIDELESSPDQVVETFKSLYAKNGSEKDFEIYSVKEIIKNPEIIQDIFTKGVVDYKNLKKELTSIDHSSNQGDIDDLYSDTQVVSKIFSEKIQSHPAKNCVLLACEYLQINNSVDPFDRYFFKHHVPVIANLSGNIMFLHESMMTLLRKYIH